jgi:hypothetical protein
VVKALDLDLIEAVVVVCFVCLEGWHILLRHSMRSVKGLPREVLVEGLVHLFPQLVPPSEDLSEFIFVVEGVLGLVDVDHSPTVVLLASGLLSRRPLIHLRESSALIV